jgi:hypothetical protein
MFRKSCCSLHPSSRGSRRDGEAFRVTVLIGFVLASACSDKECPPIGHVDFFDVTVADAAMGAPVCNANVRIRVEAIDYRIDGDRDSGEVTIQPDGRCHYVGRRGKLNTEHTVTVTASG